jgi:hypothetical protein
MQSGPGSNASVLMENKNSTYSVTRDQLLAQTTARRELEEKEILAGIQEFNAQVETESKKITILHPEDHLIIVGDETAEMRILPSRPDLVKYYFLVHWAGAFGTWTAWFINQHQDFPQIDLLLHRSSNIVNRVDWKDEPAEDTKILHYNLPGIYWDFAKQEKFEDYLAEMPYATKTYTIVRNHRMSKCIIRPYDDHGYTLVVDRVMEEQDPRCLGIIGMQTTPKYFPMMARRLAELKELSYDEALKWVISREHTQMKRYHRVQRSASNPPPTHWVNIGKLLEYDEAEYDRLLAFMDQPKLDNWRELVDIANTDIWNRYR